ncbi:MAG: hypothetical protein DCF27_01645 [Lysobacteraceae bacterium]|nr:MAG: hypothetical protein DCF27_01645 [Xanthomonadaceae bacterium]
MRLPLILAGCLALAACNAPTPDPTPDTLPEPQSTQLRDAINEPLDKAKAVEANQAAADAGRRKALEDAGG